MSKIRPIYADSAAVRGGNGKTTWADRLRDHCLAMGRKVCVVRIESQRALLKPKANEIHIATEDLALSNDAVGGAAAVLEPMWDLINQSIDTNGVVIADWGAGQMDFRLELLGGTRFDERLKAAGVVGYTCIVTDRSVDSMRQATESLRQTREYAPGLQRVLVDNELRGNFVFATGTEEAKTRNELMAEAATAKLVRLPAMRGKAMTPFAAVNLTAWQVINADPKKLEEMIGRSELITEACISKVGEWWKASEIDLARVFPAPMDNLA